MKTNQVAAICSFFVPGLGQLISGKPISGVVWFLSAVFGYICMLVPGFIIHVTCVYKASKIGVSK